MKQLGAVMGSIFFTSWLASCSVFMLREGIPSGDRIDFRVTLEPVERKSLNTHAMHVHERKQTH
jgi:hypothetical protein